MWRKTGFAKRLLLCTSLVVVVGGLAVAALVTSQISPASGFESVYQCWPKCWPTPSPPHKKLGELKIVKKTDGVLTPGVTFTVDPNPYATLDPALVPAGCNGSSPTLTVTDGDTCDRHDAADGTVKLINVPAGNYLVDEPTPPPGTTFEGCVPNPVKVSRCGGSGSTTCTNTSKLGDLTIKKLTDGVLTPGVTFTVNPNPYAALDPALVPAGCNGSSPTLTVTDGDTCDRHDAADGTVKLINVPAGNYLVDEPTPPPGTTFEGCVPNQVKVSRCGGSGSTTCTNKKLGELKIVKKTDGVLTPGVTFTVNPNPYAALDPALVPAGCDDASPTLTVTDGDTCDRHDAADGTVKLINVPAGNYLVDEPTPPPGTTFEGCVPNPVKVSRCGGSGSTTCTNTPKLGELKIVKKTDGTPTPGVTFTVNPNPYVGLAPALVPAGCDGASPTLAVTDGDACDRHDDADGIVKLVNVPAGDYLVDEPTPPPGTTFEGCHPNPVRVPACGGSASTTCTNTPKLGDLTIDKLTDGTPTPGVTFTVDPNPYAALDPALVPAGCDDASPILTVTDGDACDRHDAADGIVKLVNVPTGAYLVDEPTPPPGTTFEGCAPNPVTVPTCGGSASTTCTNTPKLGDLTINKLTDGTPTSGVTFTVDPNPYAALDPALVPAGCDGASPTLAVTDGDACDRHDDADGTVKLVNVPAGEYQVDEPTPPLGTTFEGCDPNPVTVPTGCSGSTTCTNTSKLGELKIVKKTDGVLTPGVTFTVDPNPYAALDPALVPAGCDGASPTLAVTDGDACDRHDAADGIVKLVNVPAGDYLVDEPTPPPGTTFEGCDPNPVTVPAGCSGSTTCTNTPSTTDGKIIDQELIEPPSTMKVGEVVDITVRKTLHNNGPNGPIEVSIISTASPPSGCTAIPKDVPSTVTLPVSVDVVIEEMWTIQCSTAGNRVFQFENCIEVETPGVGDVNLDNNCASTGLALIVAQVRCPPWDRDCDGYYNYYETMWGSDPDDAASTPEHKSAAGTCTDGLDNDKDGLTDNADPGC